MQNLQEAEEGGEGDYDEPSPWCSNVDLTVLVSCSIGKFKEEDCVCKAYKGLTFNCDV